MSKKFKLINENYFRLQEDEPNMTDPKESREVQIGKEILGLISGVDGASTTQELYDVLMQILPLSQELIKMHLRSNTRL